MRRPRAADDTGFEEAAQPPFVRRELDGHFDCGLLCVYMDDAAVSTGSGPGIVEIRARLLARLERAARWAHVSSIRQNSTIGRPAKKSAVPTRLIKSRVIMASSLAYRSW